LAGDIADDIADDAAGVAAGDGTDAAVDVAAAGAEGDALDWSFAPWPRAFAAAATAAESAPWGPRPGMAVGKSDSVRMITIADSASANRKRRSIMGSRDSG
jgi:hypothetical protein